MFKKIKKNGTKMSVLKFYNKLIRIQMYRHHRYRT